LIGAYAGAEVSFMMTWLEEIESKGLVKD
jgi:hypothetical protein